MEDLAAWADIIGTVAGILVLSSFLPHVIKAYKTKKMFDVSIHLDGTEQVFLVAIQAHLEGS